MGRQVTITCNNCGDKKTPEREQYQANAWLRLTNPDLISATINKVRLDEEHDFCCYECLEAWARKAAISADRLITSASNVSPRGTFCDDDLGLQY